MNTENPIQVVMSEGLLKVQEVAELLRVPESSVRKLVFYKKIPTIKLGRTVRFSKRDIMSWLERNTFHPTMDGVSS